MSGRKVTILSFGVRGDVQPLLALARGLGAAGWTVKLAADAAFGPWIERHGVGFAPLRFDWRAFLNSAEGRQAMAQEVAPKDSFERLVRPMLDDCWGAAQGADALIYDTMLIAGNHMAEKLGVPAMMTSVAPNFSPTRAFPPIGTPKLGWGGWGNRLSYELYRWSWWWGRTDLHRWCESTLGFRPSWAHDYWRLRGRRIPIAYSYSCAVVPRPADWPPEWWAGGYWFLDEPVEFVPPARLAAFLDRGPAPVYVGFNSMVSLDPEKLTRVVVEAVARSGQRAVLVGGWGGLVAQAVPDSVIMIDDAPHRWLFPRMSAVAFHGGAGTTALALSGGKPLVTCPLTGDQPFWGRVVADLGCAPPPIPQRELLRSGRVDDLAAALRLAATDPTMRERAAQLGAAIRGEDGVAAAVGFVARHLA